MDLDFPLGIIKKVAGFGVNAGELSSWVAGGDDSEYGPRLVGMVSLGSLARLASYSRTVPNLDFRRASVCVKAHLWRQVRTP